MHADPLPANPWLRAAAWVFDTSLAAVPASALAAALTLPARLRLMDSAPASLEQTAQLLDYLTRLMWILVSQGGLTLAFVAVIYGVGSAVAEGGFHQATWGKRLVGLRVERMDNQEMNWRQAAKRFLLGATSWASLNAGHAMAQFRADRRMLHDVLAHTQVVQEPMAHRGRGIAVCLAAWGGVTLLFSSLAPSDPVLAQLAHQLATAPALLPLTL